MVFDQLEIGLTRVRKRTCNFYPVGKKEEIGKSQFKLITIKNVP